MAKRTHGLSGNKDGRLYNLWKSIRYRCYSPTCKSYANYGGRGIVMCDEWRNDYLAFREWALSNGYNDELTDKGVHVMTIDRINVNGNYEPSNCRFITNAEQAKNKRNTMSDEERYATCPVCGKTYTKSQRNGEKTCSYSCARKLYFINHPNTKDYTKVCPVCGKSFDAKRGGHFKDAVCCSRECANLLRSPIWVFQGEEHRVMEWAEIVGINAHCLLHRKEMGWDIEKILTTPMRKKNYGKSKL